MAAFNKYLLAASFDLDREVETLRTLAWQERTRGLTPGGRPCRLREQKPLRQFFRLLLQGEPRYRASQRAGYAEENVIRWMQQGRDGHGPMYVRFRQLVLAAQTIGRGVRSAKRTKRREAAHSSPLGRPISWGPLLPSQIENSIPRLSQPADGAILGSCAVTPAECPSEPVAPPDPAVLEAERQAAEAKARADREARERAAVEARDELILHLSGQLRLRCDEHGQVLTDERAARVRAELDALLRASAPKSETSEQREARYRRWRNLTNRPGLTDREWHRLRSLHFRDDGFY